MPAVSLHYWAGARAAAGVEFETVDADSVGAALDAVCGRRGDARFTAVVRASSVMRDGRTVSRTEYDHPLDAPVRLEILPPFAGGDGR